MLGKWSCALMFFSVACGPTPPKSAIDEKVKLSELAPPGEYVVVRELAVQSGKGCGLLADRGSREDAERKLRVAADKLGATYVKLTEIKEPKGNQVCLEHEYKLKGVAYRIPVAAAPPPNATPAPPLPTLPRTLLDYEGDGSLGKPARSSDRSSVALSLAPGETGGSALSVTYHCTGEEPQALLDVWYDLGSVDFRGAKVLTLSVKADGALPLSVSFMDGNRTGYTVRPEALAPGVWQRLVLPLAQFSHDAYGPPADKPGAPVDLSAVHALGFSPLVCEDGHFLIDDVRLE
jgi:hypothetical protein